MNHPIQGFQLIGLEMTGLDGRRLLGEKDVAYRLFFFLVFFVGGIVYVMHRGRFGGRLLLYRRRWWHGCLAASSSLQFGKNTRLLQQIVESRRRFFGFFLIQFLMLLRQDAFFGFSLIPPLLHLRFFQSQHLAALLRFFRIIFLAALRVSFPLRLFGGALLFHRRPGAADITQRSVLLLALLPSEIGGLVGRGGLGVEALLVLVIEVEIGLALGVGQVAPACGEL